MKILVVDDIKFNAVLVELVLERAGHAVLHSESGMHALEILEQDMSFDIVVCDLMMPGMDGIELFRQAKELPQYLNGEKSQLPPFILLTASKNVERMVEAKLLGFADILLKPLDAQRLMDTIERIKSNPENYTSELTKAMQSLKDVQEQIIARRDLTTAETTIRFLDEVRTSLQDMVDSVDESEPAETEAAEEPEESVDVVEELEKVETAAPELGIPTEPSVYPEEETTEVAANQ